MRKLAPIVLLTVLLLTFSACGTSSGASATGSPEGTKTSTLPLTPGANVTDARGDVSFGFIDIVSARIDHTGESVTAYLEMADLPNTLVFNKAPKNLEDYAWEVCIDVDGNPDTGDSGGHNVMKGVDYALSICHFSNGEPQTGSILATCQKQVWVYQASGMASPLSFDVKATIEDNTLILKGDIPGLNDNSRWYVQTSYWDSQTPRLVQDRLPDNGFFRGFATTSAVPTETTSNTETSGLTPTNIPSSNFPFADTITSLSITPPDGTTLTVGDKLTVTAKLSCDLNDVQDADLILGYREKGSLDMSNLGTASVSVDNNVVEISGEISGVPDWNALEIVAMLAPSGQTNSGSFTPLSAQTVLATYSVRSATTPATTAASPNDTLTLVSITPASGTSLKVGDQITVTANISYTLMDKSNADLQVLYREGTTNRYSFLGDVTVSQGSGTAKISGSLTVPNYEKLDFYAMIAPAKPANSTGTVTSIVPLTLIASYPIKNGTPTVTPTAETETPSGPATPSPTTGNGSISDPEGDVPFGFIDIVSAKVEHDGQNITGYIEMANLPNTFVFDQAPKNYTDYGWEILFDVDNDANTGGQWGPSQGVDYVLFLAHTSNGGPQQEGSLMSNCQAELLKFDTSSKSFAWVQSVTVNIEGNTIALKGTIPGMNDNSQWTAETVYWDPTTRMPVQDYLPLSWYGM